MSGPIQKRAEQVGDVLKQSPSSVVVPFGLECLCGECRCLRLGRDPLSVELTSLPDDCGGFVPCWMYTVRLWSGWRTWYCVLCVMSVIRRVARRWFEVEISRVEVVSVNMQWTCPMGSHVPLTSLCHMTRMPSPSLLHNLQAVSGQQPPFRLMTTIYALRSHNKESSMYESTGCIWNLTRQERRIDD